MSCERFEEAVALEAAGELGGAEREALLAHLEGCAPCREELAGTRALLGALRDASPRLPPEREARFAASTRAAAEAARDARRRRARFLVPAGFALAAAAALAIWSREPPPELAVAPPGPAAPALDGEPPALDEETLAATLPELDAADPLGALGPADFTTLAIDLDEPPEELALAYGGAPSLDDLSDAELERLLGLLQRT